MSVAHSFWHGEALKRRVKIICTLGPSSNSYEKVRALALSGMNVARLNFSHGTHEQHRGVFDTVRRVSRELNKPIAILQDLQGPKIRVGEIENGQLALSSGQTLVLTAKARIGTADGVSISYPNLAADLSTGERVLMDDGRLELRVERIVGENVHCVVVRGGLLKPRKGVNLPGAELSVSAFTEKDQADLNFGLELGVDYVALSFVRSAQEVLQLKERIAQHGDGQLVVAKIEKPQAVNHIDAIIDAADGIMLARGDLGVEMAPEEVPPLQKQIIRMCIAKFKPVITATQMLESMTENPQPTRAEASDVANAVLDGSDAVMLSAETASGQYPIEAVDVMSRIIHLIECQAAENWSQRRREQRRYPVSHAIAYSCTHAADMVDAVAIITATELGTMSRSIARFRPVTPIIAVTPSERAYQRLSLVWGVTSFKRAEIDGEISPAVADIIASLKESGILEAGQTVLVTAGVPFDARRETNTFIIEQVS